MVRYSAGVGDRLGMDVLKRSNVTVTGSGEQTILFVHGFGCDQRMWHLVAPAFEARYRVVLLDLVGLGHSDWRGYDPARYNTLQAHADDVLAVLHALSLQKVIFVGHSVSAMIGVLAAIREPESFARLVLVAASPYYLNDENYAGGFEQTDIDDLLDALDSNYLGGANAEVENLLTVGDQPRSAAGSAIGLAGSELTIARHFARVTFLSDSRAALARMHTPTLILQCAHDRIAPPIVGSYLHGQLSDSELVVLDASGHCPQLSVPRITIAAINHFLSAGVCSQYE